MYVLVDMEWISNQRGNHWPTQLAATRVDAQWNTVDIFSALFRPKDFSFQQWGHTMGIGETIEAKMSCRRFQSRSSASMETTKCDPLKSWAIR